MKKKETKKSFRSGTYEISNNSYIDLLNKYFLIDKTEDLDSKHKEWSRNIYERN